MIFAALAFKVSRTANNPSKFFSVARPTMVAPWVDHSEINFPPAGGSPPFSRSQSSEPTRTIFPVTPPKGEGWDRGNLTDASSPRPSPPLGEESEKPSGQDASTPQPRTSFQLSNLTSSEDTLAIAWLIGWLEFLASAAAKILNSELCIPNSCSAATSG